MRARVVVVVMVAIAALGSCGGGSSSNSNSTKAKSGGASQGTGGADFCAFARNPPAALNQSGANPQSASAAKQYFDQARTFLDHAASIAPAAVKADANTLANAYHQLITALAAVNYDTTKLTASEKQALSSPQITAANSRITHYLTQTCGISTTSTSVPTSPSS